MQLRLTLCLVALVLATACSPIFSDARMLRPGQVEVTPSMNPVFISENEDTTHLYNDFGIRAEIGVTNRVSFGGGPGGAVPHPHV